MSAVSEMPVSEALIEEAPARPRLVVVPGRPVAQRRAALRAGAQRDAVSPVAGGRVAGGRVVGGRVVGGRVASGRVVGGTARSARSAATVATTCLPAPVPAHPARRPPATAGLRLTRRGRAVITAAAMVLAAAVASLIVVAAAAGAQATNHGQSGGGYAGMREIVVRPGQTLWSIAAAAEPSADPRVVIQQIMTVNSLTTTQIEAGQLLWVPK